MLKILNKPLNDNSFLDVLRGVAVIMVISIHSFFLFGNLYKTSLSEVQLEALVGYSHIFRLGSAGPMLFFMISGFLLGMLYHKNYSPGNFYKKRFLRIMPMWILFSVVFALAATFITEISISGAEPLNSQFGFTYLVVNVTFLSIFVASIWDYVPGGWSIQGEMVNYGLFHFIKKYGISAVLYVQIALSSLSLLASTYQLDKHFTVPVQIIATATFWFILGIIGANLIRNKEAISRKTTVLTLVMMGINIFTQAPNQISNLQSYLSIILAIMTGVIIYNIRYLKEFIISIGKYSYGIYLMHMLILLPISYSVGNYISFGSITNQAIILLPMFLIVITTLITWIIAMPIYKYFEKPFIDYARR